MTSQIASADVGALGPGEHRFELPTHRLPAGLFFATLVQHGRSVTRRVILFQ